MRFSRRLLCRCVTFSETTRARLFLRCESFFLPPRFRCASLTLGFWARVWPCPTPPPSWKLLREICPCTSKPTSTLSSRTSSCASRARVEDVWQGNCLGASRLVALYTILVSQADSWGFVFFFLRPEDRTFDARVCGFLRRWLQPDSYADPQKTALILNKDDIRCGWPATVVVQTKDQYGDVVHVPNMKVRQHNLYFFKTKIIVLL